MDAYVGAVHCGVAALAEARCACSLGTRPAPVLPEDDEADPPAPEVVDVDPSQAARPRIAEQRTRKRRQEGMPERTRLAPRELRPWASRQAASITFAIGWSAGRLSHFKTASIKQSGLLSAVGLALEGGVIVRGESHGSLHAQRTVAPKSVQLLFASAPMSCRWRSSSPRYSTSR